MEFRQIRYFVAVAEEQHYGRAAQKLYVSQPALSQQIKELERAIGVDLFSKKSRLGSRTIELTEAGHFFLSEARRLLQMVEKTVETTRQIGGVQNILRLGVYRMLFRGHIVELLKLFSMQLPHIEIKIVELPTIYSVQEALVDEMIDLGVTLTPLRFPSLSEKTFKIGSLKLILSENHPLAAMPDLQLLDLEAEKWIEIEKSAHPVLAEINTMCEKAGLKRTIIQEVSSLDLMASLVSLGLGIGFVPTFFDAARVNGIVAKNLVDTEGGALEAVRLNQVVAYKNEKPRATVLRFLDLLGSVSV